MRWGIIAALVFCCGFCAADEIDLEAVRGTENCQILSVLRKTLKHIFNGHKSLNFHSL